MASPLPPDPYAALGVSKAATPTEIKTAYRKLALKCHPDKVADPAQKADAAVEFHKVQQAYEILGDDDKRERYNAQVRLAELKRENLERQSRGSPKVEVRRDATYEVRSPAYSRSRAYDEPPRARARADYDDDDDDDYYDRARRSSKYAFAGDGRRTSPRRSSVRERVRVSPESERVRAAKTRDQDRTRGRREKSSYGDTDDSDEYRRYEEHRRRKNEEAMYEEEERRKNVEMQKNAERLRERAEEERREARRRDVEEAARRASKGQREDPYDRGGSSYRGKEKDAMEYMSRVDGSRDRDGRPSATRSSSNYEQVRRKSSDRPTIVRRTSDRPSARIFESVRHGSGPRRDRKGSMPEIPEDTRTRQRPSLEKFESSPAAPRVSSRMPPERSATMDSSYATRDDPPPPPIGIRRAETMPITGTYSKQSPSSSRVRGAAKIRTELHDSGYSSSSPNTPTTSDREQRERERGRDRDRDCENHPLSTKAYRYTTAPAEGGGVKLHPVPIPISVEDGYRTVVHEPPPKASTGTTTAPKRSTTTSPVRHKRSDPDHRARDRDPVRDDRDRDRDRDRDSRPRDRRPPPTTRTYTYTPRGSSSTRRTATAARSPSRDRDRDRGRARHSARDRDRDFDYLDYDYTDTYDRAIPIPIPKHAGEPLSTPLKRTEPPLSRPELLSRGSGGSFGRDDVAYARRVGPEDVRWAPPPTAGAGAGAGAGKGGLRDGGGAAYVRVEVPRGAVPGHHGHGHVHPGLQRGAGLSVK